MKTLLALEELIRSYNGITALDNFKALEALKVLKELDLKYEGFGEDTEISSKVLLKDYLEGYDDPAICTSKKYFNFSPKRCSVTRQNGNCLIEIFDSDKSFYVCDSQIELLYEMIADLFEFGEISETTEWKRKDSAMSIRVHDVSDTNNSVISLSYDSNFCEILNRKYNNFDISRSMELVLNINTLSLAKVLKRLLFSYRSQEMVKLDMPESNKIKYSDTLGKVLSSVRYFNVLSMISMKKS